MANKADLACSPPYNSGCAAERYQLVQFLKRCQRRHYLHHNYEKIGRAHV